MNDETLEIDVFRAGLGEPMRDVLVAELALAQRTRHALDSWAADPSTLDGVRLIRLIERIGKGRLAQLLAPRVSRETCPGYIRAALESIRDAVA